MITCILENISLNVGQLVISDIKFFKTHDGMHLLFLYLIIELCNRARVKV